VARPQLKPYNRELYQTAIYRTWSGMLSRCNNPKVQEYNRYGGRGIKVCSRWRNFADFYEDMGSRHAKGLELDRIDNNGNYEPSNCRWVTPKLNARNRRNNRFFILNGSKKTLAEWIELSGVSSSLVRQRFYVCKWSIERALEMEKQNA
jgi:hypothetical protein